MTEMDVDRDELKAAIRDMLDSASTSARMRALTATPDGEDENLWRLFAEMGLPGIEVCEDFDGAGGRFGDLAVVLTELGSHLASCGLFGTAVLGAGALAAVPAHPRAREWLPRIAAGTARASAALLSETGEPGTPGLRAARTADGWRVSGSSGYVPDAGLADILVLRALDPDGGELLLVAEHGAPGLNATPVPMLDVTRRFSDISAGGLEAGSADVLAAGPEAVTVVRRLLERAALATAADALGAAQRTLDMTVDYAKTREQFGRPIGSFQAVKHRCADMFVAVTTARIALEEALDSYDTAPGTASAAASRAKAYTCDAAAQVVEDGIDLHGGIGFTWEHDMHLLLNGRGWTRHFTATPAPTAAARRTLPGRWPRSPEPGQHKGAGDAGAVLALARQHLRDGACGRVRLNRLHQLDEDPAGLLRVQEDLLPGRVIQERVGGRMAAPVGGRDGGSDVGDLAGDVMQPRHRQCAGPVEEGAVRQRLEQLDLGPFGQHQLERAEADPRVVAPE